MRFSIGGWVANSRSTADRSPPKIHSAETLSSTAGQRGRAEVDDSVSALCIFGGERSALERLFATHPPIEKRIEAVRGVQAQY